MKRRSVDPEVSEAFGSDHSARRYRYAEEVRGFPAAI